MSQYQKTILDNGVKIVSYPMAEKQSAALGIWINVGGRYESGENKGSSHFLEHMLFKGSKKYSCRRIKESIEGVGGSLNGFTSEELTCYLVKMPAKYLKLALDVLSDMVLNPLLSAQEIEKEKTVILEELKMYKDQPQSYVYELLDELLWPKHPLGEPIIGTVESVNSVTRESLSLFRGKYYTPSNIVISAAGGLDADKLSKDVSGIFASCEQKDKNDFVKATRQQDKPQLKVFYKDTEQTHLAMGFHSMKRGHKLKYAQGILHVILGANMSSRLFNELREKRGLAYEIGTQVKRFDDTGAFLVHAGIDNRKVADTVGLILKELEKIKSAPVAKDEFSRAKEFYLGQLMLALEDTLDHMLWLGDHVAVEDRTYTLSQIVKDVNEVTISDVQDTAAQIFKEESLNLALIGPLKDIEKDLYPRLKIG